MPPDSDISAQTLPNQSLGGQVQSTASEPVSVSAVALDTAVVTPPPPVDPVALPTVDTTGAVAVSLPLAPVPDVPIPKILPEPESSPTPAEEQTAQTAPIEPFAPPETPPAPPTSPAQADTVGAPLPPASSTSAPPPLPSAIVARFSIRDLYAQAIEKIRGNKAKKLERIMAELMRKGKITNDEVEKLLHCSDATATRYLSELEKQGRVIQGGKTGRSVTYTKI